MIVLFLCSPLLLAWNLISYLDYNSRTLNSRRARLFMAVFKVITGVSTCPDYYY